MDRLSSDGFAHIFHYLPAPARCAVMATCHRIHDDPLLRKLLGGVKHIRRRTKGRQDCLAAKGQHPSQAQRKALALRKKSRLPLELKTIV